MTNWRQILSYRDPEGTRYSQDEDFGERDVFTAYFSETVSGTVWTNARCKREAIDRMRSGNFQSEANDSDNFVIDYDSVEKS
jgi:hypothetical protein